MSLQIRVKLLPTTAKEEAEALFEKAKNGEEVEISNWEVLAHFHSIVAQYRHAHLRDTTKYNSGNKAYSFIEMDTIIENDIEIRPTQ